MNASKPKNNDNSITQQPTNTTNVDPAKTDNTVELSDEALEGVTGGLDARTRTNKATLD